MIADKEYADVYYILCLGGGLVMIIGLKGNDSADSPINQIMD